MSPQPVRTSKLRTVAACAFGALLVLGFAAPAEEQDDGRFVRLSMDEAESTSATLINIKVVEKPLKSVLDFLSQMSRVNIRAKDEVVEKKLVSLELEGVTYRGVLEFLAKKYGLLIDDANIQENIILVSEPPKVSMIFNRADIREVIRTIAIQSGANIVMGPEVRGEITMRLENVPWHDALGIVVKTLDFVAVNEVHDTIRITTPQRLSTQLESRIFRLAYLTPDSAKYVATLQTEFARRQESENQAAAGSTLIDVLSRMKSRQGTLSFIKRATALVVKDTSDNLDAMERVVRKLDIPPKQIFVSVKIVAITDTDLERLGVNWSNGLQFAVTPLTNWPTAFPFSVAQGLSRSWLGNLAVGRSTFGGGNGGTDVFSARRTVTAGGSPFGPAPAIGLGSMGFTSPNGTTSFFFDMIRSKTNSRVIQTPQLMTLDNEEATIQVGQLFRYAESFVANTEGGGNVAGFREASGSPVKLGLQLLIIPHVTGPENNILLTAIPKTEDLDRVDAFQGPDGSVLQLPQTTQRIVVTRMLLRNNETGVIAGLRINRERRVDSSMPVFGDIPIIGRLFRHRVRDGGVSSGGQGQPTSESLMIFVTPSIIDQIQGQDDFQEQLEQIRQQVSRPFAPLGEESAGL